MESPKMTEKEINSFYSSLARTDGVLRGIFVSHPAEITKSDCFIFVINRQVLLNDAGMTGCTDALDRLVRIRGEVNPGGKLGITWILSHFHVDHVAAAIETLIPDERFSFNDVYLPPLSKLDPKYEGYINMAGLVLLLSLSAYILFNDVWKLFQR